MGALTLVSVNVGVAREMAAAKVNGKTGIYKTPAEGPVEIHSLGLANDAVCDTKNHGGPDQAVYVYTIDDYAWWSDILEAELAPGTFGENLTISGLESARCNIGDRLKIGDVVIEVTSPRIPCHVLAARMDDNKFVKLFRAAERPGLYCRVIQPGVVRAGAAVTHTPTTGPTIGIVEMFRNYYLPEWDAATRDRELAAPIAIRARQDALEKPLI